MTREEIIKHNAIELVSKYDPILSPISRREFEIGIVTELLTKIYELGDKVEMLEIHLKDTQKDLRNHKMWS